MKKYKVLKIASAVAALLLWGCNDDFLETVNPNAVTAEQFWQTTADFESGLAATYAALQFPSVTGGGMNLFDRIRTDMTRSFSFYTSGQWAFTTFTWSNTEAYIGDRWKELYVGVFRANQVLDNAAKVTTSMDVDSYELAQIKGQAYFLRGLLYFWIANSYGGAIIHTSVPTNDEIQGSFSERETVINDVVIPDLLAAIKLLPDTWDANNKGRATSGAARGILGKVYLFEEQFDDAIAQFDTLMQSGVYSLAPHVRDNYNAEGEHNDESLFEIGFSAILTPGIAAAEQELLPNGDQPGHATNKATSAAPQSLGGLRIMVPTFWATELFMKDSIDVSNGMNNGYRWSQRTLYSIAIAEQDSNYYMQPTLEGPDWFIGGAECAYWKKQTNWSTQDQEESWSSTSRSGINERILRLADVKLMYAEALLRKAGSSQADMNMALEQVDDVRERAGVITLSSYIEQSGGGMPVLHQRGTRPYSSQQTGLTTSALLNHIQMVERPLELAFEGNSIRWHDLRRWNKIGEVLNMVEQIDYTRDWIIRWVENETALMPSDFFDDYGEYLNPSTTSNLDYAINLYQNHQASNYNPDNHNYFPIPLDEINANDNLGQ